MREKFSTIVRIFVLSLLMGFTAGAGLAIYHLGEFSNVPSVVALLLPLLAGGFIGALTPQLNQALGAFLLVIIISALVSAFMLAYPEFRVDRLGIGIALELSVINSLKNVILFALPLTLVGLILGKFLSRSE